MRTDRYTEPNALMHWKSQKTGSPFQSKKSKSKTDSTSFSATSCVIDGGIIAHSDKIVKRFRKNLLE